MHETSILKAQLDLTFTLLNKKDFLSSDPLEYVHLYHDPWDQEAMALIASQLAYGNAQLIRGALRSIVNSMKDHKETPASFTRLLSTAGGSKKALKILKGFYYRFHNASDIIKLLGLLNFSWKNHGSLAAHFNSHFNQNKNSLENALHALTTEWKVKSKKSSKAFLHFLSSPHDKSACKRWCLFLKWMVRHDEVDPGTWQNQLLYNKKNAQLIQSHDLIIPVDTHILRICRELGFTHQKTASWKAATEITKKLKEFDPLDPIKYDFSISRIGIMKLKKSDFLK